MHVNVSFRARRGGLVALAALIHSVGAIAQPTDILPLSGMGETGEATVYWDFRLEQGRGSGEWKKIVVPSCWEQQGFGAYYYGMQGRKKPDDDPAIPKERGQYRREFNVPDAWRGREIRIVFEGAMTDTAVTVNGNSAGPVHQGGFYRFDYDISNAVRFGETNLLEVQVDKESANTSVNRAERRGDFWTFGGIYRPVWLEARPARHIDRVAVDARADGMFYAQVYLGGKPVAGEHIEATIVDQNGRAVTKPWTVQPSPAGPTILRQQVSKPLTWSAETPNLYRVKLRLLSGDKANSHDIETRFGFRTFEVRARDGLYLNGRKIVLKGINRHSFNPETGRTIARAQSIADAQAIKAANMNAVRMSHYPPDPHFLEAADELGLYVLNELAGWQGSYDTPTGTRLIGQIVRRDVNHPSILFWDNGNEGGWNREVDGEFDRWDPQRRAVLHPWAIHSGVNTDHYERYDSTVNLSAGPDIFMPTEFLHGLYDGGIGAGLYDYWNVMGSSPTVGGGFFWVWADEGIRRTDQQGRIDNQGNLAPDGIVGPHGEKEGSYFTVQELWSPVQIRDLVVSGATVKMHLRNTYSFTDLRQTRFSWEAVRLPGSAEPASNRSVAASGEVRGPELAPGSERDWQIPIKARGDYDVVHLTARDHHNQELWTWSAQRETAAANSTLPAFTTNVVEQGDAVVVRSAPYELTFARDTGRLSGIRKDDRSFEFGNGPKLVAYRREERRFVPLKDESKLVKFEALGSDNGTLAKVNYDGALRSVTWSRVGDAIALDYELAYEGRVDVFGIGFDMPETAVKSKQWVGNGPYHVWQNRLQGGRFDLHETAYNDPIPGETYAYPEFKGYFSDWRWFALRTTIGAIVIENGVTGNVNSVPYFGLYQPAGGINPVLDLPDVGVSLLSVIPAMGSKFDLPEHLGPQSQPKLLNGTQRGRVLIRLQ